MLRLIYFRKRYLKHHFQTVLSGVKAVILPFKNSFNTLSKQSGKQIGEIRNGENLHILKETTLFQQVFSFLP